MHMNPVLLCRAGCNTSSTRSLAQTRSGFSSSDAAVPYRHCRYTLLLITFQESLADPRNLWSEAAGLPQYCWPTPAAAWAAPVIFIMWAELMCARNPWAASAPSEMTAVALWADCREGVPCCRQRFFFFNLLVFSLPPFKCFLPWFRADISCAWCRGGRGSVSLLPSLPRCCSDTVTPPRLLTVEAAAPIPPSLQNRCRARSLIWAGDVIFHLLFKFLPHLKPHQGAGGRREPSQTAISGVVLLPYSPAEDGQRFIDAYLIRALQSLLLSQVCISPSRLVFASPKNRWRRSRSRDTLTSPGLVVTSEAGELPCSGMH